MLQEAMMRRLPVIVSLLLFSLFLLSCQQSPPPLPPPTPATQRIIPLTPSLVDTVVALGAESQMIAVPEYCHEPKSIDKLPHLTTFPAPSLEAMLALHPTLVLLHESQSALIGPLNQAKIAAQVVPIRTLAEIKGAFLMLGQRLHREKNAQVQLAKIDAALAQAAARRTGHAAPKVLFIIDRELGSLRSLVAAGPHTYVDEILSLVGATNVLHDAKVPYPQLSAEGLAALAPDVILDATHDASNQEAQTAFALPALTSIPALKNHRLYVLANDALINPGPKLPIALSLITNALY